jgi:hypothetical protein
MNILKYKIFNKYLFIIFILLIIYYRSPYILLNGRFVAEEGEFWFRNAFINGPLSAIFQVYFGSGYFNLWANISSVVALIPPLEYAPLATVYSALFIKLSLFFFVLNHKSEFLISDKDKYVVSLIILLSPFMVEEIWLNTLTSQIYLTIFSILILFKIETRNFFFKTLSYFFLLIAGLSTITTSILTPFFFYKYINKKDKSSFINFLIIFLSSLFQLFIYIYSKYNGLFETNLRYQFSYEKIINFIYNVFLKSIFGRDLTHQIFFDIYSKINILLLLLVLLFLFLFLVIAILKNIKKDNILIILGLLFIAESFLAFFGSKMQQVQGRYAVIPAFLFMIVIYRLYQTQIDSIKRLSIILIIFSLLTGVYQFKYKATYPQFLDCFNCPVWKEEISKWRLDNSYKIKIWNYPTRTMLLK